MLFLLQFESVGAVVENSTAESTDLPTGLSNVEVITPVVSEEEKKKSQRKINNTLDSEIRLLMYKRIIPDLFKTCVSNLAAVLLKMNHLPDARRACDEGIDLVFKYKRASDAKLFFRRGQVCFLLKDYENAYEDFTAALDISPQDATIAAQLKEARRHLELKRKREKQAYSKMFSE